MTNLVIGALGMWGIMSLFDYCSKRKIKVKWWQWILTLIEFGYIVFIINVIKAFLEEDSPRGAVVTGVVLGFFALVFAVLLGRFVFFNKSSRKKAPKAKQEEK